MPEEFYTLFFLPLKTYWKKKVNKENKKDFSIRVKLQKYISASSNQQKPIINNLQEQTRFHYWLSVFNLFHSQLYLCLAKLLCYIIFFYEDCSATDSK